MPDAPTVGDAIEVLSKTFTLWQSAVSYMNNCTPYDMDAPLTTASLNTLLKYLGTFNMPTQQVQQIGTNISGLLAHVEQTDPGNTVDVTARVIDSIVATQTGVQVTVGKRTVSSIAKSVVAFALVAAWGVSATAAGIKEHIDALTQSLEPYTTDGENIPVVFDEDGKTYIDGRAIQSFREKMIELGIFGQGFVPDTHWYPLDTVFTLQEVSWKYATQVMLEHFQLAKINDATYSPDSTQATYDEMIEFLQKILNAVETSGGVFTVNDPYHGSGHTITCTIPSDLTVTGFVNPGNAGDGYGIQYHYTKMSGFTGNVMINKNNFQLITQSSGDGLTSYMNFYYGIIRGSNALDHQPGDLFFYVSATSESGFTKTALYIGMTTERLQLERRYLSVRIPVNSVSTHGETYPYDDTMTNINGRRFTTLYGKGLSPVGLVFNGSYEPGVSGFVPTESDVGDETKTLDDIYPDWDDDKITLPTPTDSNLYNTTDYYPVSMKNTNDNEDVSVDGDEHDGTSSQQNQQDLIDQLMKMIEQLYQNPDNPTEVITPTIPVEDTGDTPPEAPPVISGASNGLWTIYNPTLSEVQQFGAWLWSGSLIDQIKRQFASPIDAVLGFMSIYCTPITGSNKIIKAGYLDSPVSAKEVTNQYVTIDCGQVEVPEFYHTAIDYTKSKVDIFLPFIGIVPLDCSVVTGSTLELTYRIDVLTGTCLAQIKVLKRNSDAVLYTFTGNCAVQLPITASTYTGVVGALLSLTSMAGSISTGNIPSAIGSGIQAVSHLVGGQAGTAKSGNMGANAGAMGIRIPYLVITHPTAYDAMIYNQFYGYPSNIYQRLSALSGYVRVKDIHLQNITCTEQELEMIYQKLKEGVIIS